MDAIYDENRFFLVLKPSLRIPSRTKDIGGSVVPKEVTKEVVTYEPEPETRKGKRNKTPKNFRLEFQLYLIKGTMDEVSDQHSYWFNVKDDPKTFDEAMKSHDVAFWKEVINDEIDSIMGNNTWVLAYLSSGCKPLWLDYFDTHALVARISTIRLLIALASIYSLIIHQMDVKTTFMNGELDEEVYMNQAQEFIILGNENKVDMTKEFLSSRFSMKDMWEADVIFCIRIKYETSTPMDTSEKPIPNNGHVVSQLKYYRVIGYLIYVMTYTSPDIAFAVGKLSRYTSNPGTQHWQAIQRATSSWVFHLGGGAISKAFKKQTCITSLIMEFEFVALTAAGKEVEWLRNLILEISLWSKPIAPISILCDSAATLAKAHSQIYNGKSRHLGVRHSIIHELIMNG
uniref:Reverse transcriptase Ty1/copia-type domain-containing protein n=1 Tax=Tanacetum cinerariifolium TaxID=118510 RepID=A0A6L2NPF7_TANCI|nr:hypothetical protein [Tanacetum cinerariifolium]